METARWLLSAALFAGFLGLFVFNWRQFWTRWVKQREEPAPVPFLAAVLGVMALYACPIGGSSGLWWLPLLLDFGSMPYVFWLAFALAAKHA